MDGTDQPATVKTHEIEANWKVVIENNLERYHCVVIHPELSKEMAWEDVKNPDFEGHMRERASGVEVLQPPAVPNALTIDNQRRAYEAGPLNRVFQTAGRRSAAT